MRIFANVALISLTLFYLVMLGGGTYEHLNVTTKVLSSPPDSLAILHGPFALNPVKFWATFRPLTILLFIGSLALHWKTPVRKLLLIAFIVDCLITLSTFMYFAPETIIIASADPNGSIMPEVLNRMKMWENLNWLRLLAFYFVSVLLLIINRKQATHNKG